MLDVEVVDTGLLEIVNLSNVVRTNRNNVDVLVSVGTVVVVVVVEIVDDDDVCCCCCCNN